MGTAWRKMTRAQKNAHQVRSIRWLRDHPEKRREYNMRQRVRYKYEALAVYGGPVCVCCGETDVAFLTLDHIDGGGLDHRRRIGVVGGMSFYFWLQQHGYPDIRLQVLCFNCNLGKRSTISEGRCPHEAHSGVE